MMNIFLILTVVISTLLHINIEATSIIVDDVSVTSTITDNELSLLLLTKEPFKCSTNIEFNGTLLNTTTIYYEVSINDMIADTGYTSTSDDDEYPLLIESNEISIDKTGDIKLLMNIWFINEEDDIESEYGEAELFAITGFTTMVPLIFIIFFALILKNVYVSLYMGIWIGSFIISGLSFRYALEMSLGTYILGSATSEDHQFVILFTVFLSGLVFLIQRSGGTKGFSTLITKLAKNGKHTQFACFLAGLLLFFDDYANALVVGTSFRPLTDMFYISREKLAFLVDATSAPVASMVPLSSWIGFELQQIQEQLDSIKKHNDGIMPEGLTDNAFVFFITTIPTRFYPIYMLIFQIAVISLSIEFGPMLISERLVRVEKRTDGGKGSSNNNNNLQSDADPDKDTPARWWNMLIPIITLITFILAVIINTGIEGIESDPSATMSARNVFAYSDPWSALLYGTFGASIFTIFIYMIQFKYNGSIVPPSIISCKNFLFNKKKDNNNNKDDDNDDNDDNNKHIAEPLLGFSEAIDVWIKGIAFMSPAVCILILVWAIGTVMTDIGADRYFTRIISDDLDPENLPTLIFILAALLSAVTGTSWGTMTILFPLVSPAAWKICEPLDNGVFLYTVTLSQILSGSIFGDHSSPLSDTTLLSSVASGCDVFRHVWTQMPYAIWVSFFSIICGTVMVGKNINPGICIVVGIIVQTTCTWFIAAPVITKSGRYDVFTELYQLCLNKCKGKCRKKKQEEKHEEKELVLLKKKTVDFVRYGGKEDPDFLMKFVNLTGLNILCEKCGIDMDEDEETSTYTQVNVHMAHIPAQSAADIVEDTDENKEAGVDTNIVKQQDDQQARKDDDLL